MTREETITTILLAVAQGEVPCFEMGYECIYCGADEKTRKHAQKKQYLEDVEHTPDCPIVLARQFFREEGTPLNIYDVAAERLIIPSDHRRRNPRWTPINGQTLARSEQEAVSSWTDDQTRNIVVTLVAELPEYERATRRSETLFACTHEKSYRVRSKR